MSKKEITRETASMKKKRKTPTQKLKEEVEFWKKAAEDMSKRNKLLRDQAEQEFLNSATFLQMTEKICFLENINKLNELNIKSQKGTINYLADVINRPKDSESTGMLHEDREYRSRKTENQSLKGEIEALKLFLEERDAEIGRLQEELAKLKHGQQHRESEGV